MLQAIWQLRPMLGVQVRTQRYGFRVNASRASTRQERRQSALRRPRRPRLLGGELEGPLILRAASNWLKEVLKFPCEANGG